MEEHCFSPSGVKLCAPLNLNRSHTHHYKPLFFRGPCGNIVLQWAQIWAQSSQTKQWTGGLEISQGNRGVGASIQAAEHLQSCPWPVSASSRSTVLPLHGAGTCAAGQQQQQAHWFNSQTGLPNLCSFLLHTNRGKYLGVILRNRWIPIATHVEPTYHSEITRDVLS